MIPNKFYLMCLVLAARHFMKPSMWALADGRYLTQDVESNCSVRESCAYHGAFNSKLSLCRCDDQCLLYNDCCADKQNYGHVREKDNIGGAKFAIPHPNLECVKESRITMMEPIYIVRTCPQSYPNDYIRAKCEGLPTGCDTEVVRSLESAVAQQRTPEGGPGINTIIPVTANRSGVLYKNIYCALCHQEENLVFWNVKFMSRRPFDAELFNSTETLRRLLEKALRGGHQAIGFSPPDALRRGYRTCKINSDRCLTNTTAPNTPCAGPLSYVFAKGKAYRNKNCALCNGVSEEEIGCIDPKIYLISGRPRSPPPPFAILLDFNIGMGRFINTGHARVGFRIVQKPVALPVPADCTGTRPGEGAPVIYDIFTDRCVRTTCPPGYRLGCGETCQSNSAASGVNDKVAVLKFDSVIGYLTVVGNVLSITGLAIQLAVYIHIPGLRNTPGKCLMCLSTWLLISQLIFTFGLTQTEYHLLCYIIAVFLHFGFLSYFFWMNVLAYDVWHVFGNTRKSINTKSQRGHKSFIWYSLYASVAPFIIVSAAIIMDLSNSPITLHYAEQFCWIGDKVGGLLMFALPLITIMTVNLAFFIMTARNICITMDRTVLVSRERNRVGLYAKLALIMGLTWTTGLVAMASDRTEFWYLFTVLNSCQGIFICISFVCTRKVFRSYSDKLQVYRRRASEVKTSSTKQTYALNESDQKCNEQVQRLPLKETQQ